MDNDSGDFYSYLATLVISFTSDLTMNVLITIAIGVLTVMLILFYCCAKTNKGEKVLKAITDPNRPRFRKRDKILFYGRKAMRRVKSIAKTQINTAKKISNRRKHDEVLKIAKKLLLLRKEQQPTLKVREPPPSFLEADAYESSDHRLPTEVMYLLKSVRVLGHFEQPIFLELCRYMESKFVPAGTYLFKIGDPDDSIYVVQSGCINVYISDQDGETHLVKTVCRGDNIHSLLSVIDIISGQPSLFKTVSAVAEVDSTVIRLPAKAFQIVLDRFPESLVRIVQIIMVRLLRVTFMALHHYLGLSYELMRQQPLESGLPARKPLSIHSIQMPSRGSPRRIISSSTSVEEREEDRAETQPFDSRKRSGSKAKSPRPCRLPSETEPSDFDSALHRARVVPTLYDDPVVSGSPPVRGSLDEASTGVYAHTAQQSSHTPKVVKKQVVIAERAAMLNAPANAPANVNAVSGATGWAEKEATSLTDEEILNMATEDIGVLFGLEDSSLLEGKCYLRYIKAGITITKEGQQDVSLFFLVTGQLSVSQTMVGTRGSNNRLEEAMLFQVQPGELMGSLAVLTGEPSFYKVKARTDCIVVVIGKQHFYDIMKEEPKIVLHVAQTVLKRMSPFVRQTDFALDWCYVEAGRPVFKQSEPSDCIYIVLNGRLRSVVQLPSGKKELVAEYGRGELVGIVEVLTQTDRATTILAVRDSELAQLPDSLLNLIKRRFPQIVTRLIHLLGQRILGHINTRPRANNALLENPSQEPRPTVANLNTVAILPVGDDVPLSNFSMELQHSLSAIGSTLRLTSDIIQARLGATALDSVNEYRLCNWLGQQEDVHRMVLYQCDGRMTPWTRRCIRQADTILIVACADQEPKVGQIEKEMEHVAVRAQKELILLHKEDADRPRHTAQWLNLRDWCSNHHHLRCPARVFSKKSKPRITQVYRKLFESEVDRLSDFSRLARFLTGTSIGLVLGGGGARGIAHVGIIRAMAEAGIPIDMVGGTSIGSFVGALWAEERSVVRFTQRAREWSIEFGKTWKKLFDLTYPVTSMFSGRGFNNSIKNVFKERQIEDLWIPYFCITTDITASKMRVHTNGSVWRYIRGSMSISGYLPPLCDPVDGHLLLDGGYVNNLPVEVMKSMGAQSVIAVDVGSQSNDAFTNYGDELSGWWMLWKKWNPWAKTVTIPDMSEVQSRLAYVSCCRQLEEVKNSDECEYIRPAIDRFGTLQFGAFDIIMDVGYTHGQTLFGSWAKSGVIKELFVEKKVVDLDLQSTQHRHVGPAEAKFTDLAELISRIDYKIPEAFLPDDEDEDDEEERMSVTSEPGVRPGRRGILKHRIARSEGGTPVSSTPDDDFQEAVDFSEPEMNVSGSESDSPRRPGNGLRMRHRLSQSH